MNGTVGMKMIYHSWKSEKGYSLSQISPEKTEMTVDIYINCQRLLFHKEKDNWHISANPLLKSRSQRLKLLRMFPGT